MERAAADNSVTFQHHIKRYQYATEFIQGQRVCSVACGNGYGENYMATHGNPSVIFAFDIDPQAVENAKTQNAHPQVVFSTVDKMQELVDEGSIDVFISLETIEHVNEDDKFIDTIWRALKPGGLLIISTPNKASSFKNLYGSKPLNKFHVREYEKVEFIRLLSKRFIDIKLFGQKPILRRSLEGLWRYLAYRLTGKIAKLEVNDFEIKPFPEKGKFDMAYMLATCRKPL